MKTIALRFGETFSPECGTIKAHQYVIDQLGYVWYGKLGSSISDKVINDIVKEKEKKILLIHSGSIDRYWAYYDEISKSVPDLGIPSYYKDNADKFKVWFKITKIEKAEKDVMSKYVVISSQNMLSEASKKSMNPCFYIECIEG